MEMAYYVPQTEQALAGMFGVGKQKLDQLGAQFVTTITQYATAHQLAERQKFEQKPLQPSVSKGGVSLSQSETAQLINQGLTVDQVAQARGYTPGTIISHIETLLAANTPVKLDHIRPPAAELSSIEAAFKQAGSLNWLGPVKAIVGEEFSYDQLRLARLFLSAS